MSSGVEEDIVDTCACKEFKGVLNQGRICKGKKALSGPALAFFCKFPINIPYSWAIDREWAKACLEGISEDLVDLIMSVTPSEMNRHLLTTACRYSSLSSVWGFGLPFAGLVDCLGGISGNLGRNCKCL